MIKRSYIAFLFCFFSNYATSQLSIEGIKSDSDAVKFVQYYGNKYKKGWKDVGVDLENVNSVKNLKADERKFTDSVTKRKWIKQDFNGDGKNDLIFCGRIYHSQMAVLAFMSFEDDSISCTELGTILSTKFPSTISEKVVDGIEMLELGQFYKKNMISEFESAYEKDLLIYKYGGFIEYNPNKIKKIEFDSIVYKISSPWGFGFSSPRLWLYKDGTFKVFRKNSQQKIDLNAVQEINDLLSYIHLKRSKSKYYLLNVSDLSTAYMEVYYRGRVKKIEDYGMSGTYGLVLLYTKFWMMMNGGKLENE